MPYAYVFVSLVPLYGGRDAMAISGADVTGGANILHLHYYMLFWVSQPAIKMRTRGPHRQWTTVGCIIGPPNSPPFSKS